MKLRVDTDGTGIITIHQGETPPTGTVDGIHDLTEGDLCINADTWETYLHNGTTWVPKPSTPGGE